MTHSYVGHVYSVGHWSRALKILISGHWRYWWVPYWRYWYRADRAHIGLMWHDSFICVPLRHVAHVWMSVITWCLHEHLVNKSTAHSSVCGTHTQHTRTHTRTQSLYENLFNLATAHSSVRGISDLHIQTHTQHTYTHTHTHKCRAYTKIYLS